MIPGLHIGTSGWSYKDSTGWKEIFYHSMSSLLHQYLTYFDTAEINSTFYALPKKGFIQYLKKNVDEKKFFTAKLPKKVTHDNRLDLSGDAGQDLNEYFTLLQPISDRLAALLIQLPPWHIDKMADLEAFFTNLDQSFRYAIEFRHKSWLGPETWTLLEQYDIAHVIVDEPRLPVNMRITTDFAYVRWHGHGSNPWYKYKYTEEELREWKPRLLELSSNTDAVVGYFNNHFFGYAPYNALQMLELMDMIKPRQMKKLESMEAKFSIEQTSLDQF
ncbi:DUF72 domain-containing protein [Candidatus Thorarchaeota archaeon]|nr:MAG: DUF72 domain-containing protein [Candidatus Thorarchaeota archaeon]